VVLLALLVGLSGCPSPAVRLERAGTPVVDGFEDQMAAWDLAATRYRTVQPEDGTLVVANTMLGSGVSPVWRAGTLPRDFAVALRATITKEGISGGWGLEFGADPKREHAYRVLVYASGRLCIDRLFSLYPEFIHCVPFQPEVEPGEETNVLDVSVSGDRITVRVNGDEIISFKDDRYQAGGFGLAVAGAGTQVRFEGMTIVSPQ
jgi:hypothetical protein